MSTTCIFVASVPRIRVAYIYLDLQNSVFYYGSKTETLRLYHYLSYPRATFSITILNKQKKYYIFSEKRYEYYLVFIASILFHS